MIDFKTLSDEDLYGMCLAGDEGAWQYIYNYVLEICKWKKWDLSRDQVEELAQVIILHLIDIALKRVREKNKFRGFVTIVAMNKIRESFRASGLKNEPLEKKRKDRKGNEYSIEYMDPTPGQDAVLFRLEIVAVIDTALKKLPALCHKVLPEYFNFKMGIYESYSQLSRVLKMPIPTISSGVSRCLEKLNKIKEIKELRQVAFS